MSIDPSRPDVAPVPEGTPARESIAGAVDPSDLCDCGHPGYDGHDMRSVPPACMTPDCPCGAEPQPEITARQVVAAVRDAHPDMAVRVEHTGGGCATVYIGPWTPGDDGSALFALGPGWFAPDGARFDLRDCYLGPDDDGESDVVPVTSLDVVTAYLRERCPDCGHPLPDHLSADECHGHGIDPGLRDGLGCAVIVRVSR